LSVVEYALTGGVASGTIINAGTEQVLAGGSAVGATVSAGGFLVISSGGTVNRATIAGATMEIQSGALAGANPITYAGGGALILDASANFGGMIADFTEGDFLDLKDIAFGSSTSMSFVEAGSNLSGTLTVTDGSHTAHLTLVGSYTPGQFTSASDGHGGTVVTDPPLLWPSTPDTGALLWQPAQDGSSTSHLAGSSAALQARSLLGGTWLGDDPSSLLWQPTATFGVGRIMAAGGFLQDQAGAPPSSTVHQPTLGG